ncbi:MAG TPA: hypothetical protein VNJ09_04585, partial [Chthonomonadales bacterium]|nr:hypothetical protein [Chthonomonadales bacterium]
NDWGPKGIMVDMDMFASVGLRYIHEATPDAEVKAVAERYTRALFTEERYFHPAGYFTDCSCFDTSYNGISLYFGTWCALMSDWGFARRAMDQAYRLRAHLSFPDPAGNFSGPSHMSSRTSADPPHDQWQSIPRHCAAGMISDHALYLCPAPSAKAFDAAPQTIAAILNRQLASPFPPDFQPWRETHWSSEINFAYEHYQRGHYERLLKLVKLNSPLLKSPYQRNETFIREFAKAFIIAKFPTWGGAIHMGPVGKAIGNLGLPYGYGGGQLSAYWTPSTGAVLLGRRRGAQGHAYDAYAEWQSWPIHAVTGLTELGELVSSSRIEQPEPKSEVGRDRAIVRVSGVMPKYNADRTAIGPSGLQYQRRFRLGPDGVRVTTTVTSSAPERMTELYESIPVFLREQGEKPAVIWFQIGDTWEEATPELRSAVRAIRVDRFTGSVLITFSRPCAVKLSPQVWRDGFQTQAECRTILVDLIGEQSRPCLLRSASVEYTIRPGPRAEARAHSPALQICMTR